MKKWAVIKKCTSNVNKKDLPIRKLSDVINELIAEGYYIQNNIGNIE